MERCGGRSTCCVSSATEPACLHSLAHFCSATASGGASHKGLLGEHWLVEFYYTFPYALFVVCLLSETCLACMFMLKYEATFTALIAAYAPLLQSAFDAVAPLFFAQRVSVVQALLCFTFPVFAMKQLFSVLQGITALRRVLAMDEARRSA